MWIFGIMVFELERQEIFRLGVDSMDKTIEEMVALSRANTA